ncbi:hypothetical protein Smp_038430 [Schistosoma mansoni]|uniref:Uncharacterized protein n=1 Tax=Schistosoma mansoni TaxID=6183 RepID=G4VNV1_SCHMA|nr:hypothetical protein Smp_038430 [Schistosoma mansoni]|eukprot:XP_018653787.1 hypothetical protein Smp_038430 [Schistosoma mansoni]
MSEEIVTGSVHSICSLIDEYTACRDVKNVEKQFTLLYQCIQDSDLPYVVQWVCNWLGKLCLLDDSSVLLVFEQGLLEISTSFDCDQCVLLLQGCLSTYSNVGYFTRILKAISVCAIKIELKYFGRIKGVFNFCEDSVKNFAGNDLSCALYASADLFRNLFSPTSVRLLNPADKCFLRRHNLYMISMLLYTDSKDKDELPMLFMKNLSNVCEGLYTFYLSCRRLLLTSPDTVLYGKTAASVIVPSWIQLLHYFFTSHTHELYKFWPLVFTHEYWIDLICPFVHFLLDVSRSNSRFKSCKADLIDFSEQKFHPDRYFRLRQFTMHFIGSLFRKNRCSLQRAWWDSHRFKLLEYLEVLATEPVSNETLPNHITQAISYIEQIVSSSTYLARFHIYAKFLEPTQGNVHHGWRGHVITLFKNHLHNLVQSIIDSKVQSEVTDPENSANSCYSEDVKRIFKYVFRYPLPFSSQEDLIDESSWLLSALNLALYVFMKSKSYPSPLISYIVKLMTNDSDGKISYFSEFLCNLKSCLDQHIAQYQARISALQTTLCNTGDTKETNRLTSELGVQESVMLRLRLLEMTFHQTQTLYLQSESTSYM